jgi:hypothetical protein
VRSDSFITAKYGVLKLDEEGEHDAATVIQGGGGIANNATGRQAGRRTSGCVTVVMNCAIFTSLLWTFQSQDRHWQSFAENEWENRVLGIAEHEIGSAYIKPGETWPLTFRCHRRLADV